MPDQAAAARLAAELMPVSVVVAGRDAATLVQILSGAGLAAEMLSEGLVDEFDLGILLTEPGAATTQAMQGVVAGMAKASGRLLLLPRAPAGEAPALPELTAWFEIFAELGYQPVVDFDAGFLAQGAFLVDRSATAAETELGAFAERLSLGGALAASTQRVASLEAELAGGERALHAQLLAREQELRAMQAEGAALGRRLDAMLSRVEAADAAVSRLSGEVEAQNAGWDALRGWVRAAVARMGDGSHGSRRGSWIARLLGRGSPLEQGDQALLRASPLFDAAWYIASNPELAATAADPVQHYLVTGAAAGADPGPWFDSAAYVNQHPELRASGANPLLHAIRAEAREAGQAGRTGAR